MSGNFRVRVGTPQEMGQRFVDAWHRAERGEAVSETNITFPDLASLLAVLTPKRLDLLRYVRHHEVRNVTSLAADLRRDYKNVYKDVEALAKVGLLSRTRGSVVAPYAELDARFVL
jgi:predicted transcriptional regulator